MRKRGLIAFVALTVFAGVSYANSNLFYPYVDFPVGSGPRDVAVGDLNGDGRTDVVVATHYDAYPPDPENDYHLHVFLQIGSGGLSSPVKYPTNSSYNYGTDSIAVGDINHDGREDVIVGNGGMNIEVFLQNTSGGLEPGMTYPTGNTYRIRLADLNNDGLLDVAGLDIVTDTVAGFFQNSNGTLNPPVTLYAEPAGSHYELNVYDFLTCDFNADGLEDILVFSKQYYVSFSLEILLQQSEGGFADPVKYDLGHLNIWDAHEFVAGDVNGDGLPDVVLTHGGNRPTSKIGILFQNGLGSFQPMVSYDALDIPASVTVADMNSDGKKDIIVVHPGWESVGVFLHGTGDTLLPEESYRVPYAGMIFNPPLAIGDIDGDGLSDIVTTYDSGMAVLYNAWGETEIVSTPATPVGPSNCTTEFSCTYTVDGSTSDFGHSVQYLVDWGDGTDTGWFSGTVSLSKRWRLPGAYSVRAIARCAADTSIESAWSAILLVNVSYSGTEIWAMNDGNYWYYLGSDPGGNHWGSRVQIAGPDVSTVPGLTTYEAKGYEGDNHRASTWYSVTRSEMKEWKEWLWDPHYDWLTMTVSEGLIWFKNPMIPGDHWISTATAYLTGGPTTTPFTLSLEVYVLGSEFVTIPGGTYNAYKFRQIFHTWANGGHDQSSRYVWFVPYLGIVKVQGESAQVEELAATNVTVPLMFLDVPPLHFARSFIENLATAGITSGCASGPPLQFCPDDNITRGQMAVFLVTSLESTTEGCTGRFADVPTGHPYCAFIEKLAADGITGGCTTTHFCPDEPVTRGQMAVFIEAALGNHVNPCSGLFTDIAADDSFCGFIEKLAADGVTGGCSSTRFCPNDPVTRGQMAVFLVAAPPPLNP